MSTGFTAFVALFDPLNIFNETAPFINQIGSGINHQNTYIPPTRSPPTQGPTPVTRAPHNTNKHNMVARSLRIFAPSAIKQVSVIPAHPALITPLRSFSRKYIFFCLATLLVMLKGLAARPPPAFSGPNCDATTTVRSRRRGPENGIGVQPCAF